MLLSLAFTLSFNGEAVEVKSVDIKNLISEEEFLSYKGLKDFIDRSPKITLKVTPSDEDKKEYGDELVKTITGSDCDRNGKIDESEICTQIYYKLWLKYAR
jgi:hypothetical protein